MHISIYIYAHIYIYTCIYIYILYLLHAFHPHLQPFVEKLGHGSPLIFPGRLLCSVHCAEAPSMSRALQGTPGKIWGTPLEVQL